MSDTDFLICRAAIADLVHRYAFNIRTGHGADCAALFADDGVFEIREAHPADLSQFNIRKTLRGRDEIQSYVAQSTTSGILVVPLVHNLLIEVDGDKAQSSCLMTTRSWPSGHELIGEYRDSFRRTASGWLFQSRIYTIFRSEKN